MEAPIKQLGPYTIEREIGRGGMGVVYLGHDTKLDRAVAIKALPEHLAQDPDRLARFEREARTLAQLSHANVAGIYGVEESEGKRYLILEYVEGETLAERLDRGPLPVDESLELCAQIASGVEAAHDAGVIHRDLKPANIKITPDGQVKVLDFGLAKAEEGASTTGSGMSQSPTLTSPAIQHSPTIAGAILGTAAYMSPEQARGRKVDKRTDIWSFGVILYECLAGASPFVGETVSDSIGAILHKDIDLSRLPPGAGLGLRRTLKRCLKRDKNERWRDIGDVRLELLSSGAGESAAPSRSRVAPAWGVAIVASTIAMGLGAMLWWVPGAAQAPMLHAQLTPPTDLQYEFERGPPAVSPDGRRVAFVSRDADGNNSLWLHDLGRAQPRRLVQAVDAQYPFWSPDGRSVAFFDGDHLRRIDPERGVSDIICESPQFAGGGSWSANGTIVFAQRTGGGLHAVSASGGRPRDLTKLDLDAGEFAHRAPCFLPDGRRFLFLTRRSIGGENGVSVGSLDGDEPIRLLEIDSNVVYLDPGYLLYWRAGSLRAQAFDADTLRLVGDPFLIAPDVRFEPEHNYAHFSASASGTLVYLPGASATIQSELLLHDRTGATIGRVGEPGNYYSPRFSNDGRFVAVDSSGVENNGDIWLFGVESNVSIQLTSDPTDESRPIWSPDDSRIAYYSGLRGGNNIYSKYVRNPGEELELVRSREDCNPSDWHAPGGRLVYAQSIDSRMARYGSIKLLDLDTNETETILESPFNVEWASFAPGTDWFAYATDETGRNEVFLQNLTDPTTRRMVSLGGGRYPVWRADGLELFYMQEDGTILSVAFTESIPNTASSPTVLFKANSRFGSGQYHVAPDGQTFVVNTPIGTNQTIPMSLIMNWRLEPEH